MRDRGMEKETDKTERERSTTRRSREHLMPINHLDLYK